MTQRTVQKFAVGTHWICMGCGRTIARLESCGTWARHPGDAGFRVEVFRAPDAPTNETIPSDRRLVCMGCGHVQGEDEHPLSWSLPSPPVAAATGKPKRKQASP